VRRYLSTVQSRARAVVKAWSGGPARAYDDVAAELTPDEIAALLSLIVTINAWNALAVSTRAWVPGSYQP
jgi:hypothetical protein